MPAPEWCELYFQTAYDPSVAPPGHHTMSVFAQYVPHELASGTWDERREEIADATLAAIVRFAPDVADCVVDRQVLGPPDVEARDRAHRWAHLPGGVSARPDVGATVRGAHARYRASTSVVRPRILADR